MRINFRAGVRKSLTLEDIPVDSHGLAVVHDDKSIGMTSVTSPTVDRTAMSASATINTDAVDYEGEVILASGVQIANYSQNPVVMWDHGKSLTTLPIGSSESPDGELDLSRSEFTIDATTYFSQTLPLSRQIFGLIDEGVVRATSIHVVPSQVATYLMADGTEVLVTEESDMIEYSWCPFGVNPEALRRQKSLSRYPDRFREAWELQMDHAAIVLNRGSLGGDQLLPNIRKSLTAMLPKPRKLLVNPFTQEATDMSKKTFTNRELRQMTPRRLKSLTNEDLDETTKCRVKSMVDEVEKSGLDEDDQVKSYDELEKAGVLDEVEGSDVADLDDLEPAEKGGLEDGDEAAIEEAAEEITSLDDGTEKLGAKVLREAHDAVKYVVDYLAETLGPVENETVKSGLDAELKSLTDSVDTIKGIYKAAYPDMPGIGEDTDQAKSLEMEEQVKSMLAASQRSKYQTLGIASMVAGVARGSNLTAAQKKSLLTIEDKLGRMVKSAVGHKPDMSGYVAKADHDLLQSRFDRLFEQVEKMVHPASE